MYAVIAILLSIHCLFWLLLTERRFWAHARGIHRLISSKKSHSDDSVIAFVPARNEEAFVRQAVTSLINQDHDAFRVAVANDHSSDQTGAILHQLIAVDSKKRLTVYTPPEPAPGWMGKCNALWYLVQEERSEAEWYLFSDADVIHERETIRRAVSHANGENADLVAIMPRVENNGFWENVVIPIFMHIGVLVNDPKNLNDPTRREFAGIGAFTLIRRRLYEEFGGHDAIKGEVVDDMALGLLAKKFGGRQCLVWDPSAVSLRMYDGLSSMVAGFRKNMHAAVGSSALSSLRSCFGILAIHLIPLLSCLFAFATKDMTLSIVSALAYLATGLAIYQRASRYTTNKWWYTVPFYPLGALLGATILMISAYDGVFHRRVRWRGRDLELKEQQVKMM